jgi:hypothetical protein
LVSSDAAAAATMTTASLIVGTFYSPTMQVSNPKDNDMGIHPGNLAYYMQEFPRNGLKIESTHNFTWASCSDCPVNSGLTIRLRITLCLFGAALNHYLMY